MKLQDDGIPLLVQVNTQTHCVCAVLTDNKICFPYRTKVTPFSNSCKMYLLNAKPTPEQVDKPKYDAGHTIDNRKNGENYACHTPLCHVILCSC